METPRIRSLTVAARFVLTVAARFMLPGAAWFVLPGAAWFVLPGAAWFAPTLLIHALIDLYENHEMDFRNCYEDEAYAAAYAKLEFPGTYYLAFRDLPDLFARHVRGRKALDFGCGTGRSTRFLTQLGFQAIGVDIAPEMIQHARSFDPTGDYRLVRDGDLGRFADAGFDLILSAFTFDNVPTRERKITLFTELRRVLAVEGRITNLVSAPEIYRHEWASFSTKDFPENRQAQCGDQVRIIVTALEDRRPAVDVLWPEEAYREVYTRAGLTVLDVHRPLGRADEPYPWISETTTAPWTIYVLGGDTG